MEGMGSEGTLERDCGVGNPGEVTHTRMSTTKGGPNIIAAQGNITRAMHKIDTAIASQADAMELGSDTGTSLIKQFTDRAEELYKMRGTLERMRATVDALYKERKDAEKAVGA